MPKFDARRPRTVPHRLPVPGFAKETPGQRVGTGHRVVLDAKTGHSFHAARPSRSPRVGMFIRAQGQHHPMHLKGVTASRPPNGFDPAGDARSTAVSPRAASSTKGSPKDAFSTAVSPKRSRWTDSSL